MKSTIEMQQKVDEAVKRAADGVRLNSTLLLERIQAAKDNRLSNQVKILEEQGMRDRVESCGFQRITREQAVRLMIGDRALVSGEEEDMGYWPFRTVVAISAMSFALVTGVVTLSLLATLVSMASIIILGMLLAVIVTAITFVATKRRFSVVELDELNIPMGVILRVKEIKDMELFDEFRVVAPHEAIRRDALPRPIDPVVVGHIGKDDGYYFIAKW